GAVGDSCDDAGVRSHGWRKPGAGSLRYRGAGGGGRGSDSRNSSWTEYLYPDGWDPKAAPGDCGEGGTDTRDHRRSGARGVHYEWSDGGVSGGRDGAAESGR